MSGEPTKSRIRLMIEEESEQYQRMQVTAALYGMSVEEWLVATIQGHVDEQSKVETYRRQHGLRVVKPENDNLA